MIRGTYRRTADFRVSTTDADASPMPLRDDRTHLGYQDHYVVEGGRARIILTALVTPAEVQENQPALDLLWWARFRWKLRPRQVTGDTKYGTVENIAEIEREDIRAYFPLSEVGHRAGKFGDEDFVYDATADSYACPGGQTLRFLSHCQSTQRRIYAAPAGVCRSCALREQCTTAQRGRRVGRHRDEVYRERVRAYHATEPYAKAWHGLRRFRLRRLKKVSGEALLIAAGQNMKLLLSRWAGHGVRSPMGRMESPCRRSHICDSLLHDCGAPGRSVQTVARRHCPTYPFFNTLPRSCDSCSGSVFCRGLRRNGCCKTRFEIKILLLAWCNWF